MQPRSLSWSSILGFLAGALAVIAATLHAPNAREVSRNAGFAERAFASLRWPEPALDPSQEFKLTRDAEHPLQVKESMSFLLARVLGDCDINATVEVPEGGEMDLVLRKVEFTVDEPKGHGRFSILRLSAKLEGPASRTREAAVFGDGPPGGIKVTAGLGASLQIELRGRVVRATVAGRVLPELECADPRGDLEFVVRGGTGLVRYLQITPVAPSFRLDDWVLAGVLCALAALALSVCRAGTPRLLAWLWLVPLGGWLAGRLVFAELARLAVPSHAGVVLGCLWFVPLWLSLALPRRRAWPIVLAALLGVAQLELCVRAEEGRLVPFEDERLDLVFGRRSNSAPLDALSLRVRDASAVHAREGGATRVLFLGGKDIFEAGKNVDHWLGQQAAGLLAQRLRRPVESIVVATTDATARQQLALYELFYKALSAQVVVLAVPGGESEPWLSLSGRDLWTATGGAKHGLGRSGPHLRALVERRLRANVPASTPAELALTLADAASACQAAGARLVLAAGPDLDAELKEVVKRQAAQIGSPYIAELGTADAKRSALALAEAIAPLLPGAAPGGEKR